MACSESGSSKILLCLTLLVVFGSLCHCARLTTLKALAKLRGNSTRVISQSKGRDVRHGRLLIGQSSMQDDQLGRSKATNAFLDVDYQQDMGWGEPILLQERGDGVSRPTSKPEREVVDRLLKMDPRVECMGDSMKLQIQYTDSTPGSLIFVDRGSLLSPLPLSKLPPSCGYKIRSTHRDLVLVAPYDGCFVALEEDCYVLPLRWSGLPVRMSCPLRQSSPNPPMVACHPQGMVVKTGWTVSVENINVNLIGDWEPLMTASSRCGFSIVVHSEGVVISARYAPCLEKKNGMYTLELAGEQEIRISCPSLFPLQTGQTSSDGELRTETPIRQVYPSPPSLLTYIQSNVPQGTGSVDQASIKPPVTQQPTGQLLYPYPFYVKMPYGPPLTPTSEKTTHQISPTMSPTIPTPKNEVPLKLYAPSGPVAHPLYPFYPPTDALWPPQPNTPPSPVGPPFYPFFAKPTAAPWLSQPEASTGHIGQPFYPFYLPTAAPWPSQPEAPTSPAEQPLDPLYPKPTAAPWLPQPEAPPGPELQPLYPLYAKPTTSPRPSQPESPPDLVEPPLYPFYQRPTAAPWPPQPEAPPGPVEQPFSPVYHNHTGAPWPPQPEGPPGPVQQPLYPFYAKPTTSPRPSQPESPPDFVEPPLHPFYPRPTAAPWPPQPETSPGPVEQPHDSFYPKPITAPWLPQPEGPPGPVQQRLYPFYTKPTTSPRLSQPEAPPDLVEPPLYPFYPRPTAAPWPPHPEAPPGLEQPFYPRPPQPETSLGPVEQPFYPVYHNHTGAPWSPQPEGPPGPVQQSHYPFYAYQTTSPRPSQPEAPPGLVEQPHYPFYPRPTSAPWPPHAEAPPDLEQPLYPFYPRPPQPNTSPGPVEQPFYPVYQKPTGAPWLPQPEAPPAMVEKPLYPVYTGPTTAPMTPQPNAPMDPERQPLSPVYALPTAAPNMPQPEAPYGQVKPPLYHFPFYLPKPSSIDSQNPLPVYCPQFCQSVSLNCCPQIAFHHHVHQIIPFGLDAQDSPSLNKGPQSQPSGAYSGFGNDLLSIPRQKPTDSRTRQATETSTPVPITIPSLQSGNAKTHLLPPDGNLAAPHYISSKPANPERTIFPYDEPRYLYPSWSYLQQSKELQSLTQSPSPASYTVSTMPQDQRYKQENPVLQYESHNVQPQKQLNLELFSWDMNNPSGSSNGQYGQQKPIVKHQMLQDDESQINDKYTSPNNISGLQTLLRGSRKSNNHGSTLHSSADPKSYVLLQHGPPAGQPNGDIDSPLTSGDLVHDANLRAQLSRHHGKKPERLQNLKTPQEKSKRPKLLG
ncbi:proline-rich protein 36-like [Pungitius pungitius]|uniref:proline-rich protein 36-like n=1 Tax=Pungitius pungitius TaxID=134920 RepID=UPI002E167120